MKKYLHLSVLLAFGLLISNAVAGVTITGFGTGQFTSTFSDFSNTQTATTFNITGTDFGLSLFGDVNPSPVNISGSNTTLQLTATWSGTSTSIFQIELFDTNGKDKLYQASFADFTTPSPTNLVTLTLVSTETGFNNQVVSFGVLTSGTGATVNLTMDTLTAVPEPSTYALLGLSALFITGALLRRKAQA